MAYDSCLAFHGSLVVRVHPGYIPGFPGGYVLPGILLLLVLLSAEQCRVADDTANCSSVQTIQVPALEYGRPRISVTWVNCDTCCAGSDHYENGTSYTIKRRRIVNYYYQ